jgi:hypothetical protein
MSLHMITKDVEVNGMYLVFICYLLLFFFNNNNNNNHLLDLKCMYINKNGSSLWITAITENQRLFTSDNFWQCTSYKYISHEQSCSLKAERREM